MNAKDTLDKHLDKFDRPNNTPYSLAEDAMKEYAKEKCKEQRELCFKEIYNSRPKGRPHTTGGLYYQSMTQKEFRDTILNAPEPELK